LSKNYWIVTPFLLLFALGFFYTSVSSLRDRQKDKNAADQKISTSDSAHKRMDGGALQSETTDIFVAAE